MPLLRPDVQHVTAFAPATCANVAVGFDILGFAVESVGDTVTLTRRSDHQVLIEAIDSSDDLPLDPQKNTATVGLLQLMKDLEFTTGFSLHLQKGIPLSSGMGGSAASAVAALVAVNGFLTAPLSPPQLAKYALLGESISSGHAHPDNIIPCLLGGLTLIYRHDQLIPLQLPTASLYCALVHPHLQVSTREARAALSTTVPLSAHVAQSALLAAFVTGLHRADYNLIRDSLQDILIEPQRAHLVSGFYDVKKAGITAGALGVSFSGSGPSLFALCENKTIAARAANAMVETFRQRGSNAESWISTINRRGAHITQTG